MKNKNKMKVKAQAANTAKKSVVTASKTDDSVKKTVDDAAKKTDVALSESTPIKKKRKFTRKTLFKVMFVASILFIMVSLTYSWFSESNSARVTGLNVDVSDPNNLLADGFFVAGKIDSIAGDGTSFFKPIWKKELIGTQGGFYHNGNVKSGEYIELDDDVVSKTANAQNLFVKDFTLTISGEHDVYLVSGSGVTSKQAGYEYLEGAIRVAFLKLNAETQEYELCFVWLPNVKISKDGTNKLDTDIVRVSADENGDITEELFKINAERGSATFGGVEYFWGSIDENAQNNIFIDRIDGTSTYRCVIWLDGNDRECDNELLDKDVVATFKFLPVAVEVPKDTDLNAGADTDLNADEDLDQGVNNAE